MKSIILYPNRGPEGHGPVCLNDANRTKPGVWPLIIFYALMTSLGAIASAQTRIDLRTQAKSVDFSAAGFTKPSKIGTTIPGACSIGETFLKTDATAGQNFYVCTASNVWTLQGAPIPSVVGFANMVLATDGTTLIWKALGGDASGAPGALTVSRIQGRNVAGTAPSNGQVLTWNQNSSQWEPQVPPAGDAGTNGGGSYAVSFTAQTTVTVPGLVHQLGSANLLVGCYDTTTSPYLRVQPNTVSVNGSNYDVVVTFSLAQTGRCVLEAGGSGGGASMASQLGDTATAILSFGAIPTGSCSASQAFTLTGAAPGDSVAPGWPSTIEPGLLGNMWVSAPNTLSVRMCNFSGATLIPASASYRGTVLKSFLP
jgi:hypothetical protein